MQTYRIDKHACLHVHDVGAHVIHVIHPTLLSPHC